MTKVWLWVKLNVMKASFPMKLSRAFWICATLLGAIIITGVVFSIVNLARWSAEDTSTIWLHVLTLIINAILVTGMLLIVFNSRYIIDDNRVCVFLGFFWVSIPIKDVIMVRTNPKREIYLMYYNVQDKKTGEQKLTFITINSPQAEQVSELLIRKNEKILFDVFEAEQE